jgi:hypothetical protein
MRQRRPSLSSANINTAIGITSSAGTWFSVVRMARLLDVSTSGRSYTCQSTPEQQNQK